MITALFFGSFNPIHKGHIAIGNYIATLGDVEEVWYIVSPLNPLKDEEGLIPGEDRLKMVELAFEGNPKISASGIELDMPLPSYTINTLRLLKRKYPEKKFAIIMGSDNLVTLDKWKEIESIVAGFELLVYPRPGDSPADLISKSQLLSRAKIRLIDAPLIEISSTEIRQLIISGKDVESLIDSSTLDYINSKGLYKPGIV